MNWCLFVGFLAMTMDTDPDAGSRSNARHLDAARKGVRAGLITVAGTSSGTHPADCNRPWPQLGAEAAGICSSCCVGPERPT